MYINYQGQKVYPEDIQCVFQHHDGRGAIFVGNIEAAQNEKTLRKHNIKAVLTASRNTRLNHSKSTIPYYLYVPGDDHQKFDLSKYFEESINFIHNSLKTTNILVHCLAGVSRSVTLVLAYLMKHHSMPLKQAYLSVRKRRKIINPNRGFLKQLEEYEKELSKKRMAQTRLLEENSFSLKEKNRNFSQSYVGESGYNPRFEKPKNVSSALGNRQKYENKKYLQKIFQRESPLTKSKLEKKKEYQSYVELNKQLDEKIALIRQKYLQASDFLNHGSRVKSRYETSTKYNTVDHEKGLNENYLSYSSIKNAPLMENKYVPSKSRVYNSKYKNPYKFKPNMSLYYDY